MKIRLVQNFETIISVENLLSAWNEFLRGKRDKNDVQEYAVHLMDNILSLHDDLANHSYCHGGYDAFFVNDPKRRHIHKASVRDRLLHHAIYRILYPFFDRTFISDSYSCRNDKGMHKAINRFRAMTYQVGKNNTQTCWVLKCDIKKFFASVDHEILLNILSEYIPDKDIIWLLGNIIWSFETGLPLGNLTSQLFANVYMNVFDQWVKHKLKAKSYIRYADDFVFLSTDRLRLANAIPKVQEFLSEKLKLTLHPDKVFLKTRVSGIDFLGWVHFLNYRILRDTTKRRMLARIKENPSPETLQSYLGLMGHGNTKKLQQELLGQYWLWQ
jgi:RNA-directed DNA polymerase